MAEAVRTPLPIAVPAPLAERDTAALMAAWRKRSHRVFALRRWGPRVAIALLVFTVLWMVVRGIIALVVASDFQSGEVHMLNPKFLGRDDKGQPYSVTAQDAVRDPRRPDVVRLTSPVLRLQAESGKPVELTAEKGELDQTKRVLLLLGDVNALDDKGDRFRSDRAVIDTEGGSVRGESSVVGDGPLGHITASSYSISPHGDHIIFSGGVRSRLYLQSKAGPPAGKPKR